MCTMSTPEEGSEEGCGRGRRRERRLDAANRLEPGSFTLPAAVPRQVVEQ